ncbi:hypothetical protein [Actinophytocola xanthii]|jgi:hypothetical protein|uniref:hypothetical protein n=1 Tax=Actinophytocola xanthii TaxID=1912961 RepID=UPI0013016EA4|nr:hypothetical protein [Actinophytocola xanthii]
MREIQQIIEVANAAYREFVATEPDREVRDLVSNAVKFLTVDLTTAGEFASTLSRKAA